ncbi:MAG: stage V sporulation protein AB [Blautia sp.]
MWTELAAGFVGLCGGTIVATALAAFVIGLGIIPRYAGITHTGNHLLLYESSLVAGTILGNLVQLYHIRMPFGTPGLALAGLGFGIFLGSWIIALGEVVNVFAIMARRAGLTKGVGLVVLSLAVGKALGSLFQFYILTDLK